MRLEEFFKLPIRERTAAKAVELAVNVNPIPLVINPKLLDDKAWGIRASAINVSQWITRVNDDDETGSLDEWFYKGKVSVEGRLDQGEHIWESSRFFPHTIEI